MRKNRKAEGGRSLDAGKRVLARGSPLVSILINNYNYGSFLGAAIESALSQTHANLEVVVVDDGSTDCSREVIARFGDSIVSVLKDNGGQASAFNAGLAASKGEVVCFLDADDLFLPGKVSTILQIFENNPQIEWCFDRVRQFDNQTGFRFPQPAPCTTGPWDERLAILATGTPRDLPTATSGLSFKRSLLTRILPMPEIRIPTDSYLKLAAVGLEQGWMASEELTLQRIHGDNVYTQKPAGRRSVMASTALTIGVCLYEQIPALRRLAITMFSRGLGLYWTAGASNPADRQIARSFLRRMAPLMKLTILMKALQCGTRTLLSDSKRAVWSVANPRLRVAQ